MDHCQEIFSIKDVLNYAEIWRSMHAKEVLQLFNEVFDDMDLSPNDIEFNDEDFQNMEVVHDDWQDVRDDSDQLTLLTSTLLEVGDSVDDGQSEICDRNISDILGSLADNVHVSQIHNSDIEMADMTD